MITWILSVKILFYWSLLFGLVWNLIFDVIFSHMILEQQSCTNNQDISWWGSEPVVLGDIHGCIHDNVPAGLTWSRYNYPRNSSQPDEVSGINCKYTL